jgi:hypothetical protein
MTHDNLIETISLDDDIIEAALQWEDIDDLKRLISLIVRKAADLQDNESNVLPFNNKEEC